MVVVTDAFARLAQVVLAIEDASDVDRVCAALETGQLHRGSTAAIRAAISGGNTTVETCVRSLQEAWRLVGADLPGEALALALGTTAASVAAFHRRIPATQVVWTSPKVEGSFLRATREVVREIISGAQTELLVVGYWIAARDDSEGIIEDVIASLADAVARGVTVSVLVDERIRPEGRDNRRILVSAWPLDMTLPTILT